MIHTPLPKRPQDFQTTQAWFLYPQQTRPMLVPDRQQPPSSWTPISGAPVVSGAASFVFPVNQPPRTPSYRVVTKMRAGAGTTPSVSAQMPFTYVIGQPERANFYTEPSRYQIGPVYRPDQQTTTPAVPFDFIQPTQSYGSAWGWRQLVAPWTPIGGAVAAPGDTTIYKLDVGIPAYYTERPKPRLLVRIIHGLSRNTLDPIKHIQDQPTGQWWTVIGRAQSAPVLIHAGTVVQPSFIFPKDQPPPQWYVRRLAQFTAPEIRTEGLAPQATFVYPVNQPDLSRFPTRLQLPITVRVVDGVTAARIQSDTFQGHVRPPVYSVKLDISRYGQQGPVPQFTGAAPAAPQLYTFNVLQPNPAARLAGWTPWLWPALQQWMSTFGPPAVTVQASFVTWNQEGSIVVTWQLVNGSVVTWNMEPDDLTTWDVH